jgi:segregation and condensation protein B
MKIKSDLNKKNFMENFGSMNQQITRDDDYYFGSSLDLINKTIPSSGFDFGYYDDNEVKKEVKEATNKSSFLEIKDLIEETKLNKVKRLKAKIEAILFLSERPLSAQHIAEQAGGVDPDQVTQCLNQLMQEYEDRDSGIMIDCANGYCMQIRDEFESLTQDLLPIEIRTAVLRTLSTIALKEPMSQKDLVEIRGGGIYEHVKELVDMGLVKKTKDGNANILHTTKFFTENFKLSQNGIELQKVLKKAAPGEVEFIRPSLFNDGTDVIARSDSDEAIPSED